MKKIYIILLIFILCSFESEAQQWEVSRQNIALNVGYGRMLQKPFSLTDMSDADRQRFQSGMTWDVRYGGFLNKYLGLGVLYSGYYSASTVMNNPNSILLTYIAPVFMFQVAGEHWIFRGDAGCGFFGYKDNCFVYGRERKAFARNFGGNFSLGAEYRISRHWGVGLDARFMGSAFRHLRAEYEVGVVQRISFVDDFMKVMTLSVLTGVRYYW